MLASRKRSTPLLLALTLIFIVTWYHSRDVDRTHEQRASSVIPANRTLGFGAVVVVSRDGSERRHSLVQAANVTDFDLTIPKQPVWTEGHVQRFINGQDDVQKGSILAWLGHHNALRWFLNSGAETALILEDDVDWDIRLRSIQIPLAASAARQLLPPPARPRSHHPFASFRSHQTQYWGDHDAWDVVYLGHCGDYFDEVTEDGPMTEHQSYNLSAIPHILYRDPTLPDRSDLHPFTQSLFGMLRMPQKSRALHRSKFPLCSFGYAITRPAAERLLSELAPPQYKVNGPRAFDVALLHACNNGSNTPSPTPPWKDPRLHPDPALRRKYPSPGLRCWTLNSELFHHMPGHSLVDEIGESSGEEPGIPPVDLAAQAQVVIRNETTNINCGFWNGAFAFQKDNMTQLHYLQEHVGRQGQCLKEGRKLPRDSIQQLID